MSLESEILSAEQLLRALRSAKYCSLDLTASFRQARFFTMQRATRGLHEWVTSEVNEDTEVHRRSRVVPEIAVRPITNIAGELTSK
jgi:hypothetical protein